MFSILVGSLLLSLLHAVIPSHWLPVIAIGRKEGWSLAETSRVTFLAGLAHVISTIIIGVLLGVIGDELKDHIEDFTRVIGPTILILVGIYFIRQHYQHHHFQVDDKLKSKNHIIASLVVAMLLSPCMEIEAYFLLAGSISWYFIGTIAIIYALVSITGMLIWVRVAYKGLLKLNWHSLEHNAGMITGAVLIITGIITFFIQ
jgi:putative Mn2+ efflux pump MntP